MIFWWPGITAAAVCYYCNVGVPYRLHNGFWGGGGGGGRRRRKVSKVSNLVSFYAQATSAVILGRYRKKKKETENITQTHTHTQKKKNARTHTTEREQNSNAAGKQNDVR